jgi:hypothetical protein
MIDLADDAILAVAAMRQIRAAIMHRAAASVLCGIGPAGGGTYADSTKRCRRAKRAPPRYRPCLPINHTHPMPQ